MALGKMGINFDTTNIFFESTGATLQTHINIYWNKDLRVGIDPESLGVEALKKLEEKIPYTLVERNEFVTTSGPKIEIVL
jgi:hypothetical protein